MLITLKPHGIFGSDLFAYVCMSILSNRWHITSFLMDKAFAEHQSSRSCSVSENAHTVIIEPHGIFGSDFAYINISTLTSHYW